MSWELSLLWSTQSGLLALLSPKKSSQSYVPTAVLSPACVVGNIKRTSSDHGFPPGFHSTQVIWLSEEWLYPNSLLPKQHRGGTAPTAIYCPRMVQPTGKPQRRNNTSVGLQGLVHEVFDAGLI